MKVKWDNPNPDALPRVRGAFYSTAHPGGFVARAWPKPRGAAKTPFRFYTETEFGLAASWASDVDTLVLETAQLTVTDTTMVPRDVLTACAYGTYLTITLPDGTPWTRYRDVTVNAQLVLDQITDTVGAMIWRADIGWIEIPIGSQQEILTIESGVPTWMPASGGGAGTANIQTFAASGVWTKPVGANWIEIYIQAPGGGGGSGGRRASGTATSGGAGGGSGARTWISMRASDLNATETVTVGIAGNGGAAITADNTNGNVGTNATSSSMTIGAATLSATGGFGGQPGGTANAFGGSGGNTGRLLGTTGGGTTVGSGAGAGVAQSNPGTTGGGSGVGQTATPRTANGGPGGGFGATIAITATPGQGGIGTTKTAPTSGTPILLDGTASLGAGGGWCNADGTAGDGANGANYGAGGGGGGSSLNGHNSGKGGNGGPGYVIVISY